MTPVYLYLDWFLFFLGILWFPVVPLVPMVSLLLSSLDSCGSSAFLGSYGFCLPWFLLVALLPPISLVPLVTLVPFIHLVPLFPGSLGPFGCGLKVHNIWPILSLWGSVSNQWNQIWSLGPCDWSVCRLHGTHHVNCLWGCYLSLFMSSQARRGLCESGAGAAGGHEAHHLRWVWPPGQSQRKHQ